MNSYNRVAHREVYRNPWVRVEAHEIIHPTGVPGEHVLIVTPPASAAIVEDGDDVIFTRQARFAAGREAIEIVKGGADDGESALMAAQRELREELGIEARIWEPLGQLYEIPSIVLHPVRIFAARDLRWIDPDPEAVERIESVRMSRSRAVAAALSGEFEDAITVAAILRRYFGGVVA